LFIPKALYFSREKSAVALPAAEQIPRRVKLASE
jgi:hypothetical protein